MTGPLLVPIALAVAGWFSARWAGAVTGFAVGILITIAVVVAAAAWARQFDSLLDPEAAFEAAPRPPGYGRLCDWVYRRTLGKAG